MVDETTKNRWKKEDALKKEEIASQAQFPREMKGLVGIGTPLDVRDFPAPSGSAYPGRPDVDMKFKGWVAMFGEHFLCEVGCKRFADKSLDKVIRFIEKEIRNWYDPKYIKKKGSGIEVKSHTRKARKKKEQFLIADNDLTDEQLKRRKARYEEGMCDDVVDEKVIVSDEVEKGKVLFVDDKDIKAHVNRKSKAG